MLDPSMRPCANPPIIERAGLPSEHTIVFAEWQLGHGQALAGQELVAGCLQRREPVRSRTLLLLKLADLSVARGLRGGDLRSILGSPEAQHDEGKKQRREQQDGRPHVAPPLLFQPLWALKVRRKTARNP